MSKAKVAAILFAILLVIASFFGGIAFVDHVRDQGYKQGYDKASSEWRIKWDDAIADKVEEIEKLRKESVEAANRHESDMKVVDAEIERLNQELIKAKNRFNKPRPKPAPPKEAAPNNVPAPDLLAPSETELAGLPTCNEEGIFLGTNFSDAWNKYNEVTR